jgi:hypothetical protein
MCLGKELGLGVLFECDHWLRPSNLIYLYHKVITFLSNANPYANQTLTLTCIAKSTDISLIFFDPLTVTVIVTLTPTLTLITPTLTLTFTCIAKSADISLTFFDPLRRTVANNVRD